MKKIILALTTILMLSGATAASTSFNDFRFSPNSLDFNNFTGGETKLINATFDNTVEEKQPIVLKLTVNSDAGVSGNEFRINASLHPENQDKYYLQCNNIENNSINSKSYTCGSDNRFIVPPQRNTVKLNITAVPNIAPAEYEMQLQIASLTESSDTNTWSPIEIDRQESTSNSTNSTTQQPESDNNEDGSENEQNQTGNNDNPVPEDSAENPSQPGSTNSPATGLFAGNPTGIAGTGAFLLLVLISLLQYTGRYDFLGKLDTSN